MKYKFAIDNAVHLRALGNTEVCLYDDDADFPWGKVDDVVAGNSYRLNMPSSCYAIVHEAGLTLKYNVEFEGRDASGRGISLFDRETLREVILKLSPLGKLAFSRLLKREVLPAIESRSTEIRKSLSAHLDSEDCIRGLIAFGAKKADDARPCDTEA